MQQHRHNDSDIAVGRRKLYSSDASGTSSPISQVQKREAYTKILYFRHGHPLFHLQCDTDSPVNESLGPRSGSHVRKSTQFRHGRSWSPPFCFSQILSITVSLNLKATRKYVCGFRGFEHNKRVKPLSTMNDHFCSAKILVRSSGGGIIKLITCKVTAMLHTTYTQTGL